MMTMRGSGRSVKVAVELHRSRRAAEMIRLANILSIVQCTEYGSFSAFIWNLISSSF